MNYMIEQIHSLPELLKQIAQPLDETIRHKLDNELCSSLQRIYTVGCGDSHHAALATEFLFESLTNLPTEPMNSMQLSRYAAGFIPQSGSKTNLVIGISVSGAVSRTAEAMLMAAQTGATTAALTATPESPLGKAVEIILDVPVPEFSTPPNLVIPGVRSYLTSMLGLMFTAIHIAQVRGSIEDAHAKQLRGSIADFSGLIEQTIAQCEPLVKQAVEACKDAREFVFLGSGPNYGTALFTAAKLLEASGDAAIGQDIEEWAHLQYFAREVTTPTFIITTADRDLSRAEEIAVAANTIGRRVFAIAPSSAADLIKNAAHHFPIPPVQEMFSPILTAIPGELFAAYRAEVLQEPFFRNFAGGRNIEGGGGISRIRTSETWENWRKP